MTRVTELNELPERYRKQAEKKQKSKYNNVKTDVDGIKFDSKKEARRYYVLMAMEKTGDISELRLQVNFTLQEGFTMTDGTRVKPIVYKADFTYMKDGEMIIEDVKSEITRKNAVYVLKKKMMANRGFKISEV